MRGAARGGRHRRRVRVRVSSPAPPGQGDGAPLRRGRRATCPSFCALRGPCARAARAIVAVHLPPAFGALAVLMALHLSAHELASRPEEGKELLIAGVPGEVPDVDIVGLNRCRFRRAGVALPHALAAEHRCRRSSFSGETSRPCAVAGGAFRPSLSASAVQRHRRALSASSAENLRCIRSWPAFGPPNSVALRRRPPLRRRSHPASHLSGRSIQQEMSRRRTDKT